MSAAAPEGASPRQINFLVIAGGQVICPAMPRRAREAGVLITLLFGYNQILFLITNQIFFNFSFLILAEILVTGTS